MTAFTAGTSRRKLAERYGISESSVKTAHPAAQGVQAVL
jgi:transposase